MLDLRAKYCTWQILYSPPITLKLCHAVGDTRLDAGIFEGGTLAEFNVSFIGLPSLQAFYTDFIQQSPSYVDDRRAEIKALHGLRPTSSNASWCDQWQSMGQANASMYRLG